MIFGRYSSFFSIWLLWNCSQQTVQAHEHAHTHEHSHAHRNTRSKPGTSSTLSLESSAEEMGKFLRSSVNTSHNNSVKTSHRRLDLTAGTTTFTGELYDTGCYDTVANGNWGYCGPPSCQNSYVTCETSDGGGPQTVDGVTGSYLNNDGCKSFLSRTDDADNTDWSPDGNCDSTCTQQTDGVCDGEFLASIFKGDSVKYAYCNDKWLVVRSSGEAGVFTPNLNDVPNPPKKDGTDYVTGMDSLDVSRKGGLYYPLDTTDLTTTDNSNNLSAFAAGKYLVVDGVDTGLPADADLGLAVNGQTIFPIYNNNGAFTPQKCETDSCQEHVGQGGGQPHFHGDPFGDEDSSTGSPTQCLYGPSDYPDGTNGHSPIIGFSYDGHLIYGRHLHKDAPGFQAPLLDNCGGHVHDDANDVDSFGFNLNNEYHYHTQVFDSACPDSSSTCDAGEAYFASTTGPYNCWKGDITSVDGSSALLAAFNTDALSSNDMNYRCCDMTDYYVLSGVDLDDSSIDASTTTCTAPAAPENGSYSGTACATEGATLYSGNRCEPDCDDGYKATGSTQCSKGTLIEAGCEVGDDDGGDTTTNDGGGGNNDDCRQDQSGSLNKMMTKLTQAVGLVPLTSSD